jgi:hypothetical protein
MFSTLATQSRKLCLFGLLAASLQGCIHSDQPLLSEDRDISDPTLLGRYVAAKTELKITTIAISLNGAKYKLLAINERHSNVITVDLQNLAPPLYLAQVKVPEKTPNKYSYDYWLVYASPSFLLLNDIPCDPEIKRQAAVASNVDNFDCNFTSRDDLIAVAQIAAKHFLDNPNHVTAWIKEYK